MPKNKETELTVVKEDLDRLKSEVVELTKKAADTVENKSSDATTALIGKLAEAKLHGQDGVDVIKEKTKDAVGMTEDKIKSQPLKSMAIAFGAGVLLSAILGRK